MFGKKFTKKAEAPVNMEVRNGLQTELAEVENELENVPAQLSESFAQKMNGLKHDGWHNRDVDVLTMYQQHLEKRRRDILAQIEHINQEMAAAALR